MSIQALPFGPVWEALKGYKAFASSTPVSFDHKISHTPISHRSKMAAIVIDVFRSTTTALTCVAAGSLGIYLAAKSKTGKHDLTPPFGATTDWICGGEEHGLAIAGGVLANSPLEVIPQVVSGKFVKFFSTNGAKALDAVENSGMGELFLAGLPNIALTALEAQRRGADVIWFVCGGFYESLTLEDMVCVGRGVQALLDSGFLSPDQLDDEARISLLAATCYAGNDIRLIKDLQGAQVGTLLQNIGKAADVAASLAGHGMFPGLWDRMSATILVRTKISGVSVFVPEWTGC